MKTFGDRLKEVRKNRGIKQKELAKMIGVANSTISNWENNTNQPDIDTIKLLCDALGITPSDLIGDYTLNDMINFASMDNNALSNEERLALQFGDDFANEVMKFFEDKFSFDEGQLQTIRLSLVLAGVIDSDIIKILFDAMKLNDRGFNRLRDYLNELLMLPLYTENIEKGDKL
ncbi:MAG: helix-turn-helix domain-containing protein [Clostridia bacterium]|nr:helix-turn-helix domain-containing protein [Clostridia bacterium]